jgi:hypothetical protein
MMTAFIRPSGGEGGQATIRIDEHCLYLKALLAIHFLAGELAGIKIQISIGACTILIITLV